MNQDTKDEVRTAVREQYASIARSNDASCAPGCCGPRADARLELGYTAEDLAAVPEGANMAARPAASTAFSLRSRLARRAA